MLDFVGRHMVALWLVALSGKVAGSYPGQNQSPLECVWVLRFPRTVQKIH